MIVMIIMIIGMMEQKLSDLSLDFEDLAQNENLFNSFKKNSWKYVLQMSEGGRQLQGYYAKVILQFEERPGR